ncbi:PA14 domain-containing protein [Tautonia plasticadhaerens]|uniref:Protective antigen n=1 Tax=Tautonia plasticadhaerens TaxID=2527974 RepID=A0A518HFU4_9BACT|nr:PA14 domain-containing protein [Tautonia plasticadhaerens]QDV39733.1 Protective antigen precursor [Tautonia plasticadhaerens]
MASSSLTRQLSSLLSAGQRRANRAGDRRRSRSRSIGRFEDLEPRVLLRSPLAAPSLGAPPAPGPNAIWVDTAAELSQAVGNLQSGQTIVIEPGTYNLTGTLYVGNGRQVVGATIRGATDDFGDVVLRGRGMDNASFGSVPHGIAVYNAQDLTIANLSIGGVYYHPIDLQGASGADRVRIYHTRLFDAGEQFIKANPGGGGVDDVTVAYSLIEYTSGPPTTDHGSGVGYTNGISAHEADRWTIQHNTFRNFHTPDSASSNLWNPAVLMWNHSTDTIIEGNTFIDTDRAIAFGLYDNSGSDHRGGIIRNNFVYMRPGLFSASRRSASDAQIIVWDSPNTKVYHNTILTSGNTAKSIEARWGTSGLEIRNNLADAPIGSRDGATYGESGNYLGATASMFVAPGAGALHLVQNSGTSASVIDRGDPSVAVTTDWDGGARLTGAGPDIGADELQVAPPPPPPPPPPVGGDGDGLSATYYNNMNFTGSTVARVDPTVNFDWGNGSPSSAIGADTYSARWSGQVEAPASGTFTFYTVGDDGVRLWVDGRLLVDNWSDHAPVEDSGRIALEAGRRYDVRMEYYENGGGAVARLLWSGPSTPKAVVPRSRLYSGGGGGDATAPTVTSRSPEPGAINVPAGSSVTATFDEAVSAGTIAFELRDGSGATVPGSVSYDAATRTATLDPAADLALAATYTARLSGAADGSGNVMAPVEWSFSTASAPVGGDGDGLSATYYNNMNFTGSTVARVDPTVNFDWGNGSPSSAIGADTYSARWSGQVEAPASGTFTFYTVGDDGVRLWVDGRLLVDNWSDHAPVEDSGRIALEAGRRYDVRMEYYENGGGAVARLLWSGPSTPKAVVPRSRLYSGGGGGDATAPTVRLTSPANGRNDVPVGAGVVAVFSEPVDPGSIAFTLRGGGAEVPAALSYDASTYAATLQPNSPLSYSTSYTAAVTDATDLAGNPLAASATLQFTTVASSAVDTTPPTVTGRSPTAGASGVALGSNVTATFSESVQPGTIRFTLREAGGMEVPATLSHADASRTATLDPASNLMPSGTYTATVGGARDQAGNAMSDVSWTFTTAASAPPPGEFIETHHGRIPNFGANPTITTVASGDWSDPATWAGDRLPRAGDIVSILAGHDVTYDVVSNIQVDTVAIQTGGLLDFEPAIDTRLTTRNLLVMAGGELRIGTEADPVAADRTAEIVFADLPIDTSIDPERYGNGLIGLGRVTIHGAPIPSTFIRLAAEPQAGDRTIRLAEPATGWRTGDRIYLPDTRQLDWNEQDGNYVPQWEYLTLQGISSDGMTLTLSSALRFDHLGARDGDGVLRFLPHAADMSRHVSIRSANPSGTRGHTMFTSRADVDIRYAAFEGLGRTRNVADDNTTFDANGRATHIGTNQAGRYPVHFHHLVGPETPPDDGYQFTLVGNAVTDPRDSMTFRWGITLHDSHYGLVSDNVVNNWAGAGIVTEDGSESFNTIEGNFVSRISGTGERIDEDGAAGTGFWLRGPNNYVRDNVAVNIRGGTYSYGFNVFAHYLGSVRIPAAQGADKMMDGQSTTVDMNATPLLEFARNETYGATRNGLALWWLGAYYREARGDAGVVEDFRVWHQHGWGSFVYETNNLTLDGFVDQGDMTGRITGYWAKGLYFADYMQRGLVIRDADIQGMEVGIDMPYVADGTTLVEGGYLRNRSNITVVPMHSVNGSDDLPPRRHVIRDVLFAAPAGASLLAVGMYYESNVGGTPTNRSQIDEVFVYNHNRVAGDNFQVYYPETAPPNALTRPGIRGRIRPI